jgi:hypothetical protein
VRLQLNTGKELKIEDNIDEDSSANNEHQISEEQKFEKLMVSGGDYSPNSHTFFKQPLQNPCLESL